MLLTISLFVLLIIVKLLKKTEHVNFVSNLIMWLMVFVLIKDHVLSIIQQQVSAEYVEKGIIWSLAHVYLKTAHPTVQLMSAHVCNVKEGIN